MTRRRLLIDIDSTLYPSEQVFIKVLERLHGVTLTPDQMVDWDGWWRPFMSRRQFTALIRQHFHADEEIRDAVPYRGATTTLRAWKRAGHILHVVSDRHPKTQAATSEWLQKIGVPYDRLVLEWGIDKIAYAVEAKLDIIIDDKPATLLGAVEAGLDAATLAHPHNRAVLAEHPSIVRAQSWPALRRKVETAFLGDRRRSATRRGVLPDAAGSEGGDTSVESSHA